MEILQDSEPFIFKVGQNLLFKESKHNGEGKNQLLLQ